MAPLSYPTRGEISLKLERMSDTSLTLTLANGLERAVYIQGEPTFMLAIRVWPPDGEVSCRSSASAVLTTELVSSSQAASEFVAIEPDKRVKVVVPTAAAI